MNKIFLGYRSYGVAAAAQTYFGKNLDELTLSEMAVIAGLPKAPSTMNPLYSPKRAEERRNVVLSRMYLMRIKSPKQNMMQPLKSQSSQAIMVLNLNSVQTM